MIGNREYKYKGENDEGYYEVNGEKKNLLEEDWDLLVILDACRFDFFKDLYTKKYKHLGGDLKKAISPATFTPVWLNKIFKGFYDDIVYVSSQPYVNSKTEAVDRYGFKFDAKKHFFKIIDVWKWGWVDQLGTVPPRFINEAFLKARDVYKNKRFILHYLQPHGPYISRNYIPYFEDVKKRELALTVASRKGEQTSKRVEKTLVKIRMRSGEIIEKALGVQGRWKISKILGISPLSQEDAIGFKEGMRGIRKAYRENLELVLEQVAELLESVSGNILITADHGEFLGEYGRYGHPVQPRRSPNTEVPWLAIKRDESKQKEAGDKEINIVKERIKWLKKSGRV